MKSFTKILSGLCLMGAVVATVPSHAAAGGAMSLGIKGGLTLSSSSMKLPVEGTSLELSPSWGTGFAGGLSVKLGMGLIGFMADVLYAQRNISYSLAGVGIDVKANFIHVPLQAVFSFGPVIVTGGAFLAKPLADPTIESSGSSSDGAYDASLDYGITAGLGVMLSSFSIEARYNHGLVDMVDGLDSKSKSIDLLAGFYF